MKKLILIVSVWISLSSCSKEGIAPELQDQSKVNMVNGEGEIAKPVKATIEWTNEPAVDGFGWVIRLSHDEFEVPKEIPKEFLNHGAEVLVTYRKTKDRFPCRCAVPRYYVELTSISHLNP